MGMLEGAGGNGTERAEPWLLVWIHSLCWLGALWVFGLRGGEELGEDWVLLSS